MGHYLSERDTQHSQRLDVKLHCIGTNHHNERYALGKRIESDVGIAYARVSAEFCEESLQRTIRLGPQG